MTEHGFDPNKVPKERWAHALYMSLMEYFEKANAHPALFDLVMAGQDKFIKDGLASDKFGLNRDHYKSVYKKLRKAAMKMGMDPRKYKGSHAAIH